MGTNFTKKSVIFGGESRFHPPGSILEGGTLAPLKRNNIFMGVDRGGPRRSHGGIGLSDGE